MSQRVVLAITPGPMTGVAIMLPGGEAVDDRKVPAETLDLWLDEAIRALNRKAASIEAAVRQAEPLPAPPELTGPALEEAYARRVVARALETYELVPSWAPWQCPDAPSVGLWRLAQ